MVTIIIKSIFANKSDTHTLSLTHIDCAFGADIVCETSESYACCCISMWCVCLCLFFLLLPSFLPYSFHIFAMLYFSFVIMLIAYSLLTIFISIQTFSACCWSSRYILIRPANHLEKWMKNSHQSATVVAAAVFVAIINTAAAATFATALFYLIQFHILAMYSAKIDWTGKRHGTHVSYSHYGSIGL